MVPAVLAIRPAMTMPTVATHPNTPTTARIIAAQSPNLVTTPSGLPSGAEPWLRGPHRQLPSGPALGGGDPCWWPSRIHLWVRFRLPPEVR